MIVVFWSFLETFRGHIRTRRGQLPLESSNFSKIDNIYLLVKVLCSRVKISQKLVFVEFYLLLDLTRYRSTDYRMSFAEGLSRMYPTDFSLVHFVNWLPLINCKNSVFGHSMSERLKGPQFPIEVENQINRWNSISVHPLRCYKSYQNLCTTSNLKATWASRARKFGSLLFRPRIKKVKEVAQWVTHHIWATQSEAVCVWWWITQWGFVCVDVSLLTTSFTFFSRGLKSREPNLRALEVHVAFTDPTW